MLTSDRETSAAMGKARQEAGGVCVDARSGRERAVLVLWGLVWSAGASAAQCNAVQCSAVQVREGGSKVRRGPWENWSAGWV